MPRHRNDNENAHTMAKITLYGFDGSTYVRTVKMLLAVKGSPTTPRC